MGPTAHPADSSVGRAAGGEGGRLESELELIDIWLNLTGPAPRSSRAAGIGAITARRRR